MSLAIIPLSFNSELQLDFSDQIYPHISIYPLDICLDLDLCVMINTKVVSLREEYISFVPEGVYSDRDRFAIQIAYLEKYPKISAVGSQVKITTANTEIRFPVDFFECSKLFYRFKKEFIFDYSVVIRRKDFLDAGGLTRDVTRSEHELQYTIFLSLWARLMFMHRYVANVDNSLVRCAPEVLQKPEGYDHEVELIWGMFRRGTFKITPIIDDWKNDLFDIS